MGKYYFKLPALLHREDNLSYVTTMQRPLFTHKLCRLWLQPTHSVGKCDKFNILSMSRDKFLH